MNHMAFTFSTLDELLDQCQRLASVGIRPPTVPVQHGVTTSSTTAIPMGTSLNCRSTITPPLRKPQHLSRDRTLNRTPGDHISTRRKMVEAPANGASVAELTSRTRALSGPKLPHPSLVLASLEPTNRRERCTGKGSWRQMTSAGDWPIRGRAPRHGTEQMSARALTVSNGGRRFHGLSRWQNDASERW